jgi:hypothetical protein
MITTPLYRIVAVARQHIIGVRLGSPGTGLVIAALLGACGTDDPETETPTASLLMPQVALAPGQETTQCVVLELPNETPQVLRRIRSVISHGSHHLIAYRVPDGTPLQPEPAPCQAFADVINGASPVIIAESAESEVVYPDGVGLEVKAHQLIKLEEHFLNPGDAAINGSGTVEFTLVDPQPSMLLANLMLWGPQQFAIEPHKTGTADYAHEVSAGMKVFGLTTHEHRFGTLATVELTTTAGGPATELYRNADWEHPPLKSFDPPLAFDGTQSLRLHCEWLNTTNDIVPFGISAATNEMCFFWAYYYPSQGFQQCAEQGCRIRVE